MSELRITLKGPSDCATIPIVVEVLDDEMNRHWHGSINIGGTQSVTVPDPHPSDPPTRYAVLASLPSGQRAKAIVTVRGDVPVQDVAIEVAPTAIDSEKIKLQWAQVSRPSTFQRRSLQPNQLRSIWLRLWGRRAGGVWTVLPWPTQQATRDADLALVQYDLMLGGRSAYREYYIQIGGPTYRWRLMAVPPEDILVLVKGIELPPSDHESIPIDPIEVSLTTPAQHADVLLRYMRRGEMEEARQVSDVIIQQNLATRATASPLTSIIVGYFLLRTRDMKRLRQWLTRPAPAIRQTADVALIDAWYQLRARVPRPDRAREALITAVSRGMPVYTRGMRLLLDGLQIFDQPDETPDPELQAEVHSALRRVSRYAAALVWQAPTTTFYALDPDTPTPNSREIRRGLPDDPAGVIFLSDVSDDDLRWKGLMVDEAPLYATTESPMSFGADPTALDAPSGVMAALPSMAPTTERPTPEHLRRIALGEVMPTAVITAEYPTMTEAIPASPSLADTAERQVTTS